MMLCCGNRTTDGVTRGSGGARRSDPAAERTDLVDDHFVFNGCVQRIVSRRGNGQKMCLINDGLVSVVRQEASCRALAPFAGLL